MNLSRNIYESMLNVISAKLRSSLAILGVLVGTGAVVALIYCGQLATESALAEFKTLGTNLLSVSFQSQQHQSGSAQDDIFTLKDSYKMEQDVQDIVTIAPYTQSYDSIVLGRINEYGSVIGATEDLAKILKLKIGRGRFVYALDGRNQYAVIGSKIAKKIREVGVDPLGAGISVGSDYYTVIGILQAIKPNFFFYADIDNGVVVPIGTAMALDKNAKIQNVLMRLIESPDFVTTQNQITSLVSSILPKVKVNFRDPQQIIDMVGKQRKTFTLLLSAIGSISLVVGGIGVMNIMLVSVVERRREIGIRMALGAKQRDILSMFLIESIILTLIGGALGVSIGILVSFIIATASGWGFQFYLLPIVLGFGVSVLIGIISGIYPASRASKQNPIQCLRSD